MNNSRLQKEKPQAEKSKWRIFSLKNSFDIPFFAFVIALLVIGIVMMFSASYSSALHSKDTGYDSMFYFNRQIIFAILGVVAMILISTMDYRVLRRFALPVYVVALILLVVVLFMPAIKDVHRWIVIAGINIQPSEIAKFGIILLFARLMSLNYDKMGTFKFGVLPFLGLIVVTCALVVIEPHLSGMILIFLIGLIMMLVGGTKLKWFVIGISIAVAVFVIVFYFTDALPGFLRDLVKSKLPHVWTRLEVWQDPFVDIQGDGWQTVQSLYAIASGGFLGVGVGYSKQKHMYISEPQNDFVFSVVCEELGFIGAAIIIILFALLVWRGFVIAMRAPDKFGALVAVGMTIQVGLQAILNIAVVTNTIPNTGISLPFFSYGGSALVMLLVEMGVILSISRRTVMQKK